jgi:hypothetical protein
MHSHRSNPKKDRPKVSFFNDNEEAPSTPKAHAMLIQRENMFTPRENPREIFIRQTDQSPASVASKPTKNMMEMAIPIIDNRTLTNDKSGASSFEK